MIGLFRSIKNRLYDLYELGTSAGRRESGLEQKPLVGGFCRGV